MKGLRILYNLLKGLTVTINMTAYSLDQRFLNNVLNKRTTDSAVISVSSECAVGSSGSTETVAGGKT